MSLDKSAIQEIALSQAITAANISLSPDHLGASALPDNFEIHDLEQFLPNRRRMSGKMTTKAVPAFTDYAKKFADGGASIFIDTERMDATAVLDLGDIAKPGHAKNNAVLSLGRTAAYDALLKIANGSTVSQRDVAEFMEDWRSQITCEDKDGEAVPIALAIAAVRNISIESARKIESSEGQLSATRSAFEKVTAESSNADNRIPTSIHFECEPYSDIKSRTFSVRLGIITGDKVALTLRIVKHEEHKEAMGKELADTIKAQVGDSLQIYLGAYSRT